jgi:hypothetical protein
MLGELLWETSNIAFDTGSQLYVNPNDGTVYGTTPPVGGWPIGFTDSTGVTVPAVSGNTTATPVVDVPTYSGTADSSVVTTAVPWYSATTFGINNGVLVGIVVVGFFILRGK